MAGRKFGAGDNEPLTWAMNVHCAALVAETFPRSRIVAFSTGCVYPFVPVASGGATEDSKSLDPPGEYANSCVGRERMFEYFSASTARRGACFGSTMPSTCAMACWHDVARKVRTGEPSM